MKRPRRAAPRPPQLEHIAAELRPLARAISDLEEDPKNARVHGEANLASIRASLASHGQRKPVVVRRGVVIAGNGTLRVARELGWTHLACVEYEGTAARARAYALADNRSAEQASWDEQVLAAALREANEAGELDATGFAREDADEILANALAAAPVEDPGAGEPPKKPASKRGELYELGPHRLLCGDSTAAEDVARLMGEERAGLMATDPPYGVSFNGSKDGIPRFGFRNQVERWGGEIENDELRDEKLQEFLGKVFTAAKDLALREDAAWYLWHAHLTQGFFAAAAAAAQVLLHRQIVWTKPHFVLTRSGMYHWKHEPAFFGWRKGHPPRWLSDASQTTVWEVGHDAGEREHPTQKPVELFEIPIRNHLLAGEVCYEPFAGSGSQLVAAAKLGRRCFAIEIDPRYVDVIRRRWTVYARSAGVDPGPGALG